MAESVREVLAHAAGRNAYGSVAGAPAAREAAAGYWERRRLPTDPEQIVLAPGSKALLFALVSVLPGDVVLPQPSWVSYAAQAAIAGRRVWRVPIPAPSGGVPDPAALQDVLDRARASGGNPGILVLTVPDNPTGTVAPPQLLREVVELAAFNDLSVIADEIWSTLAAPMQQVAAYVLADPPDVLEHVARSRGLHATVTTAVHERLLAAGVECRAPAGGFYLYPDLERLRPRLDELGAGDGDALATLLLDRFGIGVLAGSAFGGEPEALRFRVATSLLYGDVDEERRRALASNDPLSLPRVRVALDALVGAVTAIEGGCP